MKTFDEWCQDREIVLNELSPKLLAMAYKIWGEECFFEGQRYEAENSALRERLENAVELPCMGKLEIVDDNDKHLKYIYFIYYKENGKFSSIKYLNKKAAEARLAELKGENRE